MYTMNHPKEWAKFFDKRAGCYRYKHKGLGVVQDTLTAIEKAFKKGVTKVEKMLQKGRLRKRGKKNLVKRWWKRGLAKFSNYCEKDGQKQHLTRHRQKAKKRCKMMQCLNCLKFWQTSFKFFTINIQRCSGHRAFSNR